MSNQAAPSSQNIKIINEGGIFVALNLKKVSLTNDYGYAVVSRNRSLDVVMKGAA